MDFSLHGMIGKLIFLGVMAAYARVYVEGTGSALKADIIPATAVVGWPVIPDGNRNLHPEV